VIECYIKVWLLPFSNIFTVSESSIVKENITADMNGNVMNPYSINVGFAQSTVEAIAGHGISSEYPIWR
jgi:hypothetical protein